MALEPFRGKRAPRRLATYDLEWIPGDAKKAAAHGFEPFQLRVAGYYDGRRYRAFTCMRDFLRAVLVARNSGMWMFAHAGGLADIQFVFDYLLTHERDRYEISAAFSGSSAIIVRVQRGRHHWVFCDSFWLIRSKLRDIGSWMGLEKGGEEGSTETFYAPLSELITYNERDCVLLYDAIRRFESVVLELGGVLEKTAASTALKLFRAKYLTKTIQVDDGINAIARQAYIASRVEVFQKKVDWFNYWDINSSFPHAMTFDAPGNCIGELSVFPKNGQFLADCTITVHECDIPPLPMRTAKRRIYFPMGSWRAWFWAEDLRLLEETGHRIERVHRVIGFESCGDLRGYATDVYERRKSSTDEGYRQVLKIFLNSLYGKFAESPFKQKIVINPDEKFFEKHSEREPGKMGYEYLQPSVYALDEERVIPHAHVPFSVAITSRARANLTRYMLQAAPVYYCDTDGMATKHEFESSKELGALKLEKRAESGHFEAPKLYAIDASWIDGKEERRTVIKAKGFSRIRDEGDDQSHRMRIEDFLRLVETRDALQVETMSRVKSNLRAGNTHPREWLQKKRYIGNLRPKRSFHENGTSRPWTVSELASELEPSSEDY